MEEKKGQGTLYLVIGIATLVVAIIGATFAYFSAQASSTTDIQGGTNTDLSTALTLNVERQLFGEAESESYNNLVPAVIDVTTDGIKKVVNDKCVAGGYTGCHLYKITATSTQTVAHASVRLADLQTTATDYKNWKYVLYKSADGNANTVTSIIEDANNADRSFAAYSEKAGADRKYTYSEATPSGFDMHSDAALTAATPEYYYLLVYLSNVDDTQNPEDSTNEKSGTGTYTGVITLDAAGGKVVANFTTSVAP